MKDVVLLLVLLLGLSGCTVISPHPKKWNASDKTVAAFFIVAHIANAFSTEAHQDYPELYYERNPILGRHPSDTEIGVYFSLSGICALLVAHWYPELRKPLLIGYGTLNTYWTIYDYNMLNKEKEKINQ
jgi:hypothetical protein